MTRNTFLISLCIQKGTNAEGMEHDIPTLQLIKKLSVLHHKLIWKNATPQ